MSQKRITTNSLKKDCEKRWGNKYGYDAIEYIDVNTPIKIYCSECQDYFFKIPRKFLNGDDKHRCMSNITGAKRTFMGLSPRAIELEIKKTGKKLYGDNISYDKLKYQGMKKRCIFHCNIHDKDFEQYPRSFLDGHIGCPDCRNSKTIEAFWKICDTWYQDKLKVDNQSIILKLDSEIKITCLRCNWTGKIKVGYLYYQPTQEHCPVCRRKNQQIPIDEIISRIKKIHDNKYIYDMNSLENRVENQNRISIFCPESNHGWFSQDLSQHLLGKGCPLCSEYKGEKRIRGFLHENNIEFESQKTFSDLFNPETDRNLLIDFYIPGDKPILIEFNGRQHYEWDSYFQPDISDYIAQIDRDNLVRKYAIEHNIKLVGIPYCDFDRIEEILTKEVLK